MTDKMPVRNLSLKKVEVTTKFHYQARPITILLDEDNIQGASTPVGTEVWEQFRFLNNASLASSLLFFPTISPMNPTCAQPIMNYRRVYGISRVLSVSHVVFHTTKVIYFELVDRALV